MTAQDNSAWQDQVYYPLGQQWVPMNGGYDVRFGSMQERDAVTGLDPTPARQYNSTLGRWMSPDPLAGDITNPQSLNRYAYALNNPTTLIDPLGLDALGLCVPPGMNAHGGGIPNCTVHSSGPDFGVGGTGWDEFDLVFPTGCGEGGCRVTLDVNGATVANYLSTSQQPPPNTTSPPSTKPPKKNNDVPLNPFAQAVFTQVGNNLSFLNPELCGGGLFGFRGVDVSLGAVKGGAYITATRDRSGSSVGTLVEGGVGPLSAGRETAVTPASGKVESSTLVFLGMGVGAFGAFNRNQIQLGLYGSAGVVGGGPYVNLVPPGTCHQ